MPTNAKNISSAEFSPSISKGNVQKQEGFSLSPAAVFDPPHRTFYLCIVPHRTEQRTKSVLSVSLKEIIKPDESLEFLFGSMFFHRQQPVLYLGKLWTAGPEYAAS